jgi:hypothetical protein
MGLADWTLKELGDRMVRISRQLHDPVLAGELLSEARQDTPLVADILYHIAVATLSGPRRGRNKDLELLRRDLLLFLALRELAQEEMTAQRVRQVGSN